MPEPFPGQASPPGLADGGLLGVPDGDGVAGLVGVVDLGDLAGIFDAARGSEEVPAAGQRWPAAELAAAAAEHMAPGQGLAYWAARFAPDRMSDYALPGAAAACRRLASWAQAAELEIVAEVATRAAVRDSAVPVGPGGLPARVPDEAAAEVALALRMSQFGASCWTDLAITLAGRLTGTAAALRAGAIDLTRARMIAEATSVLDDRAARLAEDKVLPDAGAKTPAQLRAALRRVVISVDPDAAERRREQAERRAKVGLYGDEEGTATLSGQNLPGAHAAAAMARISALARAMKSSGAGGGIDLLRAQVFIGLLLGTLPLIPPAQDPPPDPPDGSPGNPDGPRDDDDPADGSAQDAVGLGEPADSGDSHERGDCEEPDDVGEPAAAGHPDDPGDSYDPGQPTDTCHSDDPDDAGHTDRPQGSGDPADAGGPRDPGGPGHPGGPRDAGPSYDDDAGGVGETGGHDQACGPRPILAWPELPVPGQVPAALARSGTGALAGLPRGPASTGLLNLTVPWRTLAGVLAEPGYLSRLGAVTPQTARSLADAASRDTGTSWKVIVTDGGGQAIAVIRIRRSRARAPSRPPAAGLVSQVTLVVPASLARAAGRQGAGDRDADAEGRARAPAQPAAGSGLNPAGPASGEFADVLAAALHAAQNATASADADTRAADGPGGCAHRLASLAYRPPPRLRDFVAARDQTCRYPVCRQPAHRADQDHTIPYDQGGRTCSCNLGGACRKHHQIKQRPGWRLAQSAPGTFEWTTPAGRTYTATPDAYVS
jgi:hypothetical protein